MFTNINILHFLVNLSDLDEEDEKEDDKIDLKDLEDDPVLAVKNEEIKEKKIPTQNEKAIIKENVEIKCEINSEIKTKIKEEIKPTTPKVDLYSEKSENLYHRVDKMSSMGA